MVLNIWSLVKVAYDKYALWGISHWRQQRKTLYVYAQGLESSHDMYSTKHILAVTRVEVMRKHGYGYLREIEVRRADNDLYIFKEGDFPRLRINGIKDMLILIVQNRLTKLAGDVVSNFAKALRMFTRSMVAFDLLRDALSAIFGLSELKVDFAFDDKILGYSSRSDVLLGLLALAIVAVCASRAVAMPLAISCWMAAKVMVGVLDVDVLLGSILST
ncbi:hypothetical protein Tco_0579293 [Tanacetum coccineum]